MFLLCIKIRHLFYIFLDVIYKKVINSFNFVDQLHGLWKVNDVAVVDEAKEKLYYEELNTTAADVNDIKVMHSKI